MSHGRRRARARRSVWPIVAGMALAAPGGAAVAATSGVAGGVETIVGGDGGQPPSSAGVVITFDASADGTSARATWPARPGAGAVGGAAARRVAALGPLVARAAHANRIDGALLMAVIHAESAGDPLAVSAKGATGLMQLMPATGAQYGAVDLFDPRQNVAAGARLLAGLLRRYGSLDLALAAYNAGSGAVDRHGGRIPPYDETRRYVARVNRLYAGYLHGDLLPGAGAFAQASDEAGSAAPAVWRVAAP